MQRYPTATITELPSETDAAAPANVEETTEEAAEAAAEGEDFLSPMADFVGGGHGYMANVAQVCSRLPDCYSQVARMVQARGVK